MIGSLNVASNESPAFADFDERDVTVRTAMRWPAANVTVRSTSFFTAAGAAAPG